MWSITTGQRLCWQNHWFVGTNWLPVAATASAIPGPTVRVHAGGTVKLHEPTVAPDRSRQSSGIFSVFGGSSMSTTAAARWRRSPNSRVTPAIVRLAKRGILPALEYAVAKIATSGWIVRSFSSAQVYQRLQAP